jgi:hypothetical protein
MTEPSSKEFYDVVTEIKVELGVINTKVDYLNEVRHIAEKAKSTAEEAKQLALDNKEDIKRAEENAERAESKRVAAMRWVWATMLSVAGLIITVAIAVFK